MATLDLSKSLISADAEAATDWGSVSGGADVEIRAIGTFSRGIDLEIGSGWGASIRRCDPPTRSAYRTADLQRRIGIASSELGQASERLRSMRAALERTAGADPALHGRIDGLQAQLSDMRLRLQGDRVRGSLNQSSSPSIAGRAGNAARSWGTRQEPTTTMRENLEMAERDFAGLAPNLQRLIDQDMARLEEALARAGAPWTPGRPIGG